MSEGARPWNLVGNRIVGNPFTSLGLEYCPRCKLEVDTDTQASHRGTMYVFKRWCLRCGTVVKWGTWNNVPLISDVPLQAAALEWVTKPEQDRR